MVKNNQVQVCDEFLHVLVEDIYSTAGDIVLKPNYHDCDDACELAFDTKHKTARDNNQHITY